MVKRRLAQLAWFVVIVLACGRPLFRGLGQADMENDEALYTMVAESIVATGDWMTPHTYVPFLSPDFVEKPPLKFWLVAAPLRAGLLPDDESGARVWDALFGAVAFLYVFAIGRLIGGPWCGLSASLVLFTFQPLIFDHGLRTNNMEASVVLAYCGGMYHFLRWLRAGSSRERGLHAGATGAFIYLGLMTKFVAVAFLPAIAGAVALMWSSARARLIESWRVWMIVALGVIALAAPWFVYQTLRSGTEFWQIILGEHVFKRFGAGLDPTHLKPWRFYFQFVFREFSRSHAFWLVAAGSALVLWRTIKEEWVEGALLLFWFWLPVPLISLGSSKLTHYLYPFVPPLALCAGYAVAWAGQQVSERVSRAGRAAVWPRVAQAAVAVVLIVAGPAWTYPATTARLGREPHPMRTLRNCLRNIRNYQAQTGQRQAPLFVWLPTGSYQHPFFYYYRDLDWGMHDEWSDQGLITALEHEDSLMAVLMPLRDYEQFLRRTGRTRTMVPTRDLSTAIMLLPGPMSGCGTR
jgi:4-amino-4-deoxy-L-arabinose transferase-like glycosyltransferase